MSIVAHSKTVSFEVKPLPTEASSLEEIKSGLLSLYKNNISEAELLNQVKSANDFQASIYEAIQKTISDNKMINVDVQEKSLMGNFVKETTIKFPSLIQRQNGHASNQVVAKIYEPTVSRPFCDYKYPTSIFLHHILNELPMIEDLGKVMATGVIHQPAIIVVLHMPHYGERKQGSEDFLSSDLSQFRKNMAQLILDVHLLKNFLETRKNVDTTRLSLSGISLGSVMGNTVGAFEQGFSSYAFLVGGVDMANILFNRASTRKNSEVALALKDLNLDETLIRNELASVDALTWMHRYKNKSYFALNASKDDIINYEISVRPMLDELKKNGNSVQAKLNDDSHSPTGSIFKKIKEVFIPLLNFVVGDAARYDDVCHAKSN